jgi:hypothetical protein
LVKNGDFRAVATAEKPHRCGRGIVTLAEYNRTRQRDNAAERVSTQIVNDMIGRIVRHDDAEGARG